VSPAGGHALRARVAELPSQLLAGFKAGSEVLAGLPRPSRAVYVVGLGGSAIGPDLVRGIVEREAELDVHVVRGPALPLAASAGTIVILVSYSGETWETLAAYDEAGRRRCSRIVVASGGELTHRAIEDDVPHVPLPAGLPPRAAVGFLFGALLGLLDASFPESNERRLAATVERLRALEARYSAAKGPADRLARSLARGRSHIYAYGELAPVARRWATQFEENAKQLAVHEELPEALHNALVGWDALGRSSVGREQVVLLVAADTPPPIAAGIRFLEKRLGTRGVPVHRVDLPGTDALETVLAGVLLGDHVSLFLAERAGVDPLATPVLTEVRASVAPHPVPARRLRAPSAARRRR
jgi:glucose/mannose-6-phosphate isomerase